MLAQLETNTTASDFGDVNADEPRERMSLSRLRMAIDLEQKEFVAHANCQQLLSHLFYRGWFQNCEVITFTDCYDADNGA